MKINLKKLQKSSKKLRKIAKVLMIIGVIFVIWKIGTGKDPTSLKQWIDNIKGVADICVDVTVVAGGIMGISYVLRFKEKQKEATFNYLARLNNRLIYFQKTLKDFKPDIMDCFVPVDFRRQIPADRIGLVNGIVKRISENARATLEDINTAKDQFPAQKGWSAAEKKFVSFLIDCERIEYKSYHCINGDNADEIEQRKDTYYEEAMNNIDTLMKMIEERQEEREEELFNRKGK